MQWIRTQWQSGCCPTKKKCFTVMHAAFDNSRKATTPKGWPTCLSYIFFMHNFSSFMYFFFFFFFPLFQWGTQWVAGGLWSWRLQCTGCRAMMSQWSHFWQKLSECRELCTFLSKCTEIYCTLMGVVYSRMSSNRGHGMVRVWKLTDWHVTQHLANIKAN